MIAGLRKYVLIINMKKPFWNKYGKEQLCGITHSRLRAGKNKHGKTYVVFLECNHGFYRIPLSIWASQRNTCPVCRDNISNKVLCKLL